ncbi:MAG: hypothetical protein M3Y82_06290, partial [Verrucomicrobiota bacterium]|nr:hypothetical protein [Verrucomicrobiota bacterium]
MKRLREMKNLFVIAIASWLAASASNAFAFEGRIRAVITRGGEPAPLLYTVATNLLRIEVTATNRPNPIDILDRQSGQLTLLYPHNRSFVRLKSTGSTGRRPVPPNGAGEPPALPSANPSASGFPVMPMPPMEQAELKATGQTTNILGLACARYELKQRGETMEIWATDKLFPFQPYVQNQPPRFGPRMIEEQWAGLL